MLPRKYKAVAALYSRLPWPADNSILKSTKMRKLVFGLGLFFSSNLFAQTGNVIGNITDSLSKEPMAFVAVVIRSINTGASADENGRYEIKNVPPGEYILE